MNQTPQFPTAFFGAMSIVMTLYALLMIVITILVIVALWRAMRAHEQLAANVANIADALRSSKG